MSAERTTKKITTPKRGVEVVLNDEMSGAEVMDLEIAIAKSARASTGGTSLDIGDAYKSRLRLLSDSIIVSIGEATEPEAKWKALRDLPGPDYTFVMKEIEEIAGGVSEEEKKA